MPVFEFRCFSCKTKFSTLVGMVVGDSDVSCSNCGSTQVQKLISKFVHGRSEDDRIDEMADRLESMGDPETGSEMREMMKELGRASDEDMADEMEEMFESDMEGTLDADNSEESA